jgi:hypothetical protein
LLVRLPSVLAIAVVGVSIARAADAEGEYLRLRDRSRDLVRRACGECHDGTRSSALPKALHVFDTRDSEWAAHMDERQLRSASSRLADRVVPTQAKEEAKPLKVSPVEKAEFDEFVTAEIARRVKR